MKEQLRLGGYKFEEVALPTLRQRDFMKIFKFLGAADPCKRFIKLLMSTLRGHPRLLRICVSEISQYCDLTASLATSQPLSNEDEAARIKQLQKKPSEADSTARGAVFSPDGFKAFFQHHLDRHPMVWWKILIRVSVTALKNEYPEVRYKLCSSSSGTVGKKLLSPFLYGNSDFSL